ncbi:DUF4391 domain-containing protein [Neptuniibacter sp.]|uniref:DUF4391 domain-containing protein n=1 Tax=Neptuniibacter sp. TaxID=1962643 RepID=UPI003B591957
MDQLSSEQHSLDFDGFIESINIPDSCKLDKTIFKKMFLENGVLDVADKAVLKDDVNKIRWLYSLKSSTINIDPFSDSERDYPEVAILQVELQKPDKFNRIARFINRSIPYPLVLFFTYKETETEQLLVSLTDKRINQADKEKWVLEDAISTGWIDMADLNEHDFSFIQSLCIQNLPFTNFYAFYQAILDRVVSLKCTEHTGGFTLHAKTGEADRDVNRLQLLQEIDQLEAKKIELIKKLKKVKQLGKQIELNSQIKKINDKVASVKGSL